MNKNSSARKCCGIICALQAVKSRKMEKHGSLTGFDIFRYLMENGYYPSYEDDHILFELDGNMAVIEQDGDILSLRMFFSIEEKDYDNLLEASNSCMLKTYIVRPVLLDDMKNLMFSCEVMCSTYRDFKKMFPRMTGMINEALSIHKQEMKQILITEEIIKAAMPVTDDSVTGTVRKILS